MMAHNEEDIISNAISHIRNQTIQPARIHVIDDGSTDSTGVILDSMKDLAIAHVPPHPSQLSERPFNERQHRLMCEATKGMDYVLCMDADTEIPPDYVERITKQMKLDGVVVASGMSANYPSILPIEPGMVIDVRWIQSYNKLPECSLGKLGAESVADGYPSVVYSTIPLRYRRAFGEKYPKSVWIHRGAGWRMAGMLFPFLMYKAIRMHSFRLLWGYISYRGKKQSKPFRKWINRYEIERLKWKLGFDSWMFQRTDVGLFVLPKNYA